MTIASPGAAVKRAGWRDWAEKPRAAAAIFFLFTFLVVFGGISVGRRFNGDENVFIASAALVSRHGLMLYRDFHYNHMPTLVLIYAGLFRLSDHLLLVTRIFSDLCAAGTGAGIFWFALRRFSWMKDGRRLVMAGAMGLFLVLDPLFYKTTGLAWNHDFPTCCSTLAFVLLCEGLPARRIGAVGLAGLLAGLAFTARLTFATEMLPFVLMVGLFPGLSGRGRIAALAWFGGGCAVACLPSLWVWSHSWSNAWWGNFSYPSLNTVALATNTLAEQHGISRLAKLIFYFTLWGAYPGYGLLNIVLIILVVRVLAPGRVLKDAVRFEIVMAVLLAVSQIVAAMTPTPPFDKYFYAATPFLILAMVLCLSVPNGLGADAMVEKVLVFVLAVSLPFAVAYYHNIWVLPVISRWIPMQIHDVGVTDVQAAGGKTILTLEPALVLEGGGEIYPELCTGRFAARVADQLSKGEQRQYRLLSIADMLDSIGQRKPAAVLLTGADKDLEKQMGERAKELGYRAIVRSATETEWVRE